MRASKVSSEEQYRLVMECRSSGMTDYQWCMEHNIKPATFYTWVKRLRAKGNTIPDARKAAKLPARQEVVRIDMAGSATTVESPQPVINACPAHSARLQSIPAMATMEVAVAGAVLRIPNGTDTELLEQVIRILRTVSC